MNNIEKLTIAGKTLDLKPINERLARATFQTNGNNQILINLGMPISELEGENNIITDSSLWGKNYVYDIEIIHNSGYNYIFVLSVNFAINENGHLYSAYVHSNTQDIFKFWDPISQQYNKSISFGKIISDDANNGYLGLELGMWSNFTINISARQNNQPFTDKRQLGIVEGSWNVNEDGIWTSVFSNADYSQLWNVNGRISDLEQRVSNTPMYLVNCDEMFDLSAKEGAAISAWYYSKSGSKKTGGQDLIRFFCKNTLAEDVTVTANLGFGSIINTKVPVYLNDGTTQMIDINAEEGHTATQFTIPAGATADFSYFVNAVENQFGKSYIEIDNAFYRLSQSDFDLLYGTTNINFSFGFFERWKITGVFIQRDIVFANNTLSNSSFLANTNNLSILTLPDTLEIISGSNFLSFSGIKKLTLPDSITSISGNAFLIYSRIIDLTLPSVLTNIGQNFLHSCTSLQALHLPESIVSIHGNAFLYNCSSLVHLYIGNIPATAINSINNNTLSTTSSWAQMYTQGVTITGTYAADWLARIPNSNTSPFRRLIVGD